MTTTRTSRVLVLLSLLLAFWLRVYRLDAFSFWIDEALTPLRAGYDVPTILRNVIFIQDAVSPDTHPPLYYLVIHYTRLAFGSTDFALRYPSVLSGVLLLPLLYRLGSTLFNRPAALLTSWLAAVSPLYIWYAQEARMYTMLVFLGALTSWMLWRAVVVVDGPPVRLGRRLLAYVFSAALMVYTHYVGLILVAGQGIVIAWTLWQSRYRLWLFWLAGGGLLLAIPLVPFTIPRLFTGAETGYVYRSFPVILEDVIGGFSMGVTAIDWPWLRDGLWWGMAAALLFALLVLMGRYPPTVWLFMLVYLFSVPVGLGVGSLLKPMYLGVRHTMVGSPAFLLLLAVAGAELWRRPAPAGFRVAGGATVVVTLTAALTAVYSLWTSPFVAKDNFRDAVAYIEQKAGRDDAVVYGDAISMLVHEHYRTRTDLPVTALPVYPHPASADTVAALEALVGRYQRLWFMPAAPIDGRDPDHIVRAWFASEPVKIGARPFPASGTFLRVEWYDTRELRLDQIPPSYEMEVAAAGWPVFRGGRLTENSAERLWGDLFWQGSAADLADKQLRLVLVDEDGREWAVHQGKAWAGSLPPPGPAPFLRLPFDFSLPAGLPPGRYELMASGIDGNSQIIFETAVLPVEIPSRPKKIDSFLAEFETELTLVDFQQADSSVRPGQLLPIALLWSSRIERDPADLAFELQLVDRQDNVVDEERRPLAPGWLNRWPAGVELRAPTAVEVPAAAPPGRYTLRLRLLNKDRPLPGTTALWPLNSEFIDIGEVEVVAWPLRTELPAVENRLPAVIGESIAFVGYDLSRADVTLTVDLVWQATGVPPADYFVFVHLVDPESGEIVSQQDWIPAGGVRPTGGWRPEEVILDPHELDLSDIPTGVYRLNVGLFDPESGNRPEVIQNGVAIPERQLFLQEIVINGQ